LAAQGFFGAQGLHGFLAAQGLHGFFAAQGLHGFFAAQGLHGFFAAQGLTQQGLQGFFAQSTLALHGLLEAAMETPGTAMAMAAAATPAARVTLNLLLLMGIGSLFPRMLIRTGSSPCGMNNNAVSVTGSSRNYHETVPAGPNPFTSARAGRLLA
jgi:hypothetical protein